MSGRSSNWGGPYSAPADEQAARTWSVRSFQKQELPEQSTAVQAACTWSVRSFQKKQLQEQSTAAPGSSAAPWLTELTGTDDGPQDSDSGSSDKITETTDQRSNSRPFSRKPPSGKRRDIVRAMVYNGFCTTEQAKKMTTEQVLELWSEHKKTEAARSDLTHERLDVLNAQQEAGVDIISDFLSNETRWISEEMSLHILETERNQIRKVNLLREVEGGYYLCMLCSKNCSHVPQDPHLTSKEHREKESEEIYMNRLFGDSSSLRRHGPGCAIATRSAVRSYWGIEIENLLTVLREKLKTSSIKYRFGGKGSKVYSLDASDEPKLHLGLIRYQATSGRYRNKRYTTDDVRFWHELEELDADQSMVATDGKNKDQWWPVIFLQTGGDQDTAFRTVQRGYVYVVICIYQIMRDGELEAWVITFEIYDVPDGVAGSSN